MGFPKISCLKNNQRDGGSREKVDCKTMSARRAEIKKSEMKIYLSWKDTYIKIYPLWKDSYPIQTKNHFFGQWLYIPPKNTFLVQIACIVCFVRIVQKFNCHFITESGLSYSEKQLRMFLFILYKWWWLFTIFPKVDFFTCRWIRAIFVLTFSPSGENVNTNMALIHRQVKKRNIPFYIKNDMGPNDSLTDGRKSYDCDEKYHIQNWQEGALFSFTLRWKIVVSLVTFHHLVNI